MLGHRSPFLLGCLAAHTEHLSCVPLGEVSVHSPPRGSAATQAKGGFGSRSLWSGLLPPACQGDQPGSFSRAQNAPHPLTWHLPAPALGALGGDPMDSAPLRPITPSGWRICTQQAFLQTTESLAEMR